MKKINLIKRKKYAIYAKKDLVLMMIIKSQRDINKVRDHSHYTGKYREAAHIICNLKYKTPK